jgi:hypothetical protein
MATDNRQPISSFRLEQPTLDDLRTISDWLGVHNLTAAVRFAARKLAAEIRAETKKQPEKQARKNLQKSA